jgi:hypothetical protein
VESSVLIYINYTSTPYLLGFRIGNICSNNTACADDIALIGTDIVDTQIPVNMVSDYAFMEGYQLQPTKSVAIKIKR